MVIPVKKRNRMNKIEKSKQEMSTSCDKEKFKKREQEKIFHVTDEFLEEICNECRIGNIYLINGIRLQGVFCGYDSNIILLGSLNDPKEQIVYRKAIATIMF